MAFTIHMRNLYRALANPATHISGGESACTESPVNLSSNISSFAPKNIQNFDCSGRKNMQRDIHKSPDKNVQKDVKSEKRCKCSKIPVNVPSYLSKSARKNPYSTAKRSSGCFGSNENAVNIQNNIKSVSKKVVTNSLGSKECAKNHVISRSYVSKSGKKQESDSSAEQSQSSGLSTNECDRCLSNSRDDEVYSVAEGTLTSGALGTQSASTYIPTSSSGSPRENKIKEKAASGSKCITTTIPPVCDIEDIADLIPKCRIHAPFQYYLKVVE